MNDTLFAPATPPGMGGIAIIRISGPQALAALTHCFVPKRGGTLVPRRLTYGTIQNEQGEWIDEAMVAFLPAPHTYTCEDVAEIQCHGNPSLVNAILFMLSQLPLGLRPAQPGEFTRRAFENGRLDLSEAEAVMDIIGAQGTASARASLAQLRGSISAQIRPWIEQLTQAVAAIEAGIDFPEDDWEEEANEQGFTQIQSVYSGIDRLLQTYRGGRIVRNGLRCAIVGKPNVGKSSLFNAAAGFERALVSQEAGTTRDVVEECISIDGIAIRLFDTAGLRLQAQGLEQRGMELGKQQIEMADVALLVLDASAPLDADDRLAMEQLGEVPCLIALNKGDLPPVLSREDAYAFYPQALGVYSCCAAEGQGVVELFRAALKAVGAEESQQTVLTNARHAEALTRAKRLLFSALEARQAGVPPDVAAMDAREALQALGEITGQTLSQEVIHTIFSTFCVGK